MALIGTRGREGERGSARGVGRGELGRCPGTMPPHVGCGAGAAVTGAGPTPDSPTLARARALLGREEGEPAPRGMEPSTLRAFHVQHRFHATPSPPASPSPASEEPSFLLPLPRSGSPRPTRQLPREGNRGEGPGCWGIPLLHPPNPPTQRKDLGLRYA